MRGRARVVVLFVVLAAIVVAWLVASARRGDSDPGLSAGDDAAVAPGQLLGAVPDGALLLATVDVRALRRTALGERLLGRGRRIGGLGLVSEVCGADPMEGIEQLAVAIPAAGSDTSFAVFAAGRFDDQALVECATTVIRQRGGRPVLSPMGRFRVLRDASQLEPGAELAVAPGGPVVLAHGSYLREAVDAAEGRVPSMLHNRAHEQLRRAVGQGAMVATVVLSNDLRRTLVRELALQGSADSPASAVTSAGVSVQLGKTLSGHLVIRCDRPEACRELARLLDEARQLRVAELGEQQPDLAAVLKRAALRAAGGSVHVGVSVPAESGPALLDGLLAMFATGPSPPDAAAAGQGGGTAQVERDAGGSADAGARSGAPSPGQPPPRPHPAEGRDIFGHRQ